MNVLTEIWKYILKNKILFIIRHIRYTDMDNTEEEKKYFEKTALQMCVIIDICRHKLMRCDKKTLKSLLWMFYLHLTGKKNTL